MTVRVIPAALCALFVFALSPLSAQHKNDQLHSAKEKALQWLKRQKVPNASFPDPQIERRNLVLSYEIPRSDPAYRYISGRSVIYDDALAAIAFTMNRDYRSALQILLALKRLQRNDGGLWFGYNVNNDWPSENDYEGSVERTGAIAWAGYAAVYYLRIRTVIDPGFISTKEGKSILEFSQSLAAYILRLQIKNKDDIRHGLITGGKNTITLNMEKNIVSEVFKENMISWVSTEHNIDAYFFLRDLGRMTGDADFSDSSELIKVNLLRTWSGEDGQYFRGIKETRMDTVLALDCASWGSVFSKSIGMSEYAKKSLLTIEKLYGSAFIAGKMPPVYGYKPYAIKEIYEETSVAISDFYFPSLKTKTWDQIDGVWVEGSLGTALAYLKSGNSVKAEDILVNILPLQKKNGGFIYFTREIPHEFSTYTSVASSAWFVMIATALEDPAIASSFWGE